MDTGRSTSSRADHDQRIIHLAKEISQTGDRKVATLLLTIKPLLDEVEMGTEKGTKVRRELWRYNLLKVLVLVLRQDFSVISGEWETAANLTAILSDATCGLNLAGDDQRELEEIHLPRCVENMLILARHIHGIHSNLPYEKETDRERTNLMISFRVVLESIVKLCAGYFYCCTKVFSSPWLLQLVVSDNGKLTNIAMATMERLIRLDPQLLRKTDENSVFSLLDELVYKLTVNIDVSVAASACRCLLRFCDHHKPLVEILCTRYKGLRPLLRRWEGHGFDRDLRHVALLLESGSAVKARSQRHIECARYIQAIWRGYATRNRLRKANKAFSKFQKTYRLKREEQEQAKLQSQYQSELYHQMKLKRQKMMREFNEKRLQTLEILPAARIEEYLRKEKSVAATRIQTLWRGHKERSRLPERQHIAQQVRAAIRIQRAYRKWIEKCEVARQEFPTHLKPPGLTEIRRAELAKQISEWREQNPTRITEREELEAIHKEAQEKLLRHYLHIRPYRKLEYQVENLMARLDTDTELLSLAPRLEDVTQKDVEMFSSRSLPIATLAKQRHSTTMKRLQQPWWKTLGMEDEVDDDEKERVEAEVMLENLGI